MPKTITIIVRAQAGDANYSEIVAASWRTNAAELAVLIGLIHELRARNDGVSAYAVDRGEFDFLDQLGLEDFIEATVHEVETDLLDAPGFDLEQHIKDTVELLETQIQDCFWGSVEGKGPDAEFQRIKVEGDGIRLCGNLVDDDSTACTSYQLGLDDLRGYHAQLEELEARG